MNREPAPLPLVLRDPAFDGYTLTVRGVVAPSGALHEHMPSEAAAREWLRSVVSQMPPDVRAATRGVSLVETLRLTAASAAEDPAAFGGEGMVAAAILAWITAETIDATWALCEPRGLS